MKKDISIVERLEK